MPKIEDTYTGKYINCRAQVSPNCQHKNKEPVGGEMFEDGTYDGESIVCTDCYIVLMPYSPSGRLLGPEIPDAIESYRRRNL